MSGFLAVPGMGTVYGFFQATLFDEDKDDRYSTRQYGYMGRGAASREQFGFGEIKARWPSRSGFVVDPASAFSLNDTASHPGDFSPWLVADGGSQAQKFIMGTTKDASSNIIGGAIVQSFVTSTDAYVSETTSDGNGRYESPTTNAGVAHYLVAYIAGSPDRAGTTVNTLIPTNRDGT